MALDICFNAQKPLVGFLQKIHCAALWFCVSKKKKKNQTVFSKSEISSYKFILAYICMFYLVINDDALINDFHLRAFRKKICYIKLFHKLIML